MSQSPSSESVHPEPRERTRRELLPKVRRPVSPMRSAESLRRAKRSRAARSGPLPELAIIALNRMGFGPRPGDIDAFNALGSDDNSRLIAYVDQQLAPFAIPDTDLQSRLNSSGYITLGKSAAQLWTDHALAGNSTDRRRPFTETERAALMRAIYSKRQLLEVLSDFWYNHFNVYGRDRYTESVIVSYERDVLKGNLLGNFRQMLEDVATSVPMLYYLDNFTSTNAGPNENFSRELFELHCLGDPNYRGLIPQNQVPTGPQGLPIGYVDPDVYEATRAFTGWGFDSSTGDFEYTAANHDRFQKTVLGVFMPADQPPMKDGRDVLDALADNPRTGEFICYKLCRRLISDTPPQSVVDAASAIWTTHKDAPDQLRRVVRTILLSQEFRSTWGEKVKRPFEVAASAMRAANTNFNFRFSDSESDSFMSFYNRLGQPLYQWRAPNGYPDVKPVWLATNPLVSGWRMINWLVDRDDTNGLRMLPILEDNPASVRTANQLADFWIPRLLGRTLSAADRQEVVDMMAQGRDPDLDLPLDTDTSTQERLRTMVGLILNTPEFLQR